MNLDFAEIIAFISTISAIIPLLVGIFVFRDVQYFYKFMLASIATSLAFDASAFLNHLFLGKIGWINNYYDVFAIIFWGLAFYSLLNGRKKLRNLNIWITSIVLAASIYLGFANSGILSMNQPIATLGSLYILAGSTLLVMFYLIIKKEIEKDDIPIIIALTANIIYYSTATSIFVFFAEIDQAYVINLYMIKWILYILLNLSFVYIFYGLSQKKWVGA